MEEGILAPVARLDRWLDAVLLVLLVTCSARYLLRHDADGTAVLVLGGAAVLGAAYVTRRLVSDRPPLPVVWVAVVVALWVSLTLVAPSFAWTSVPIAFAVLQVLPFRYAVTVVVVMTTVVSVGWSRLNEEVDPTIIVGPVGIALLTVMSYRTLEREARIRQTLLDELTEAQEGLVAAQRRSGALAERTRVSREIHDSVGQGLSSISLLLDAAEQDWESRPAAAREHVRAAGVAAREGLDEVRRVVRDLAAPGLDENDDGETPADALLAALRRAADGSAHDVDVAVRVHGDAVAVPSAVASALVRSARGALANVVEHARARRAVLTLTYHPDEVLLDVHDDGRGFDPAQRPTHGDRGRGLAGIRRRAADLGGNAVVESSPGEGSTVSVRFPLRSAEAGRD